MAAENPRAKTNAVHISLNFDPSEKLSPQTMTEIAQKYMEKIDFGGQPYLVYQHYDAGHPHMHIVTTNIESDGTRIDLHNIGKNQSETARKELEKIYNLVPAESKTQQEAINVKAIKAEKVQYGKSETKRAVSNVVRSVTKNWKYSSIHELNAVLRQYNVVADRGAEGSRQLEHQGLVYRVLNEQGRTVGVPIKASAIYDKPTLKYLEKRYAPNDTLKKSGKNELKEKIGRVLADKPSQAAFEQKLAEQGIKVVYRKNEDGQVYGITFTDHHKKMVFNGSDLGKAFSAKALTDGFAHAKQAPPFTRETLRQQFQPDFKIVQPTGYQPNQQQTATKSLLEAFLESREAGAMGMFPKRRKKKRKNQHL